MKNLNLENFGMEELETKELKEINGGNLMTAVWTAGGLIMQAFYDIGKYDGAHLK